ncbi:hypothetical protein ONE63_009578 [Megalurothrips usitatus]|uniref:Luciferin 4-monooxygenase-like n=1 Tax=Megalurothrips usitatus TaxID=439358 RepID=A0AAV7XP96_9NEOP|nr:hypothetical protein ONE63_009578 [Megalurothrips usitatus]
MDQTNAVVQQLDGGMPLHIRYGGDGNPCDGLSYGDRALEALRKFQHETRPAQVDAHDGSAMSFRELLVQTVHAAEGWRALGLRCGDVVALVSKNHHEVFPIALGAVCAGLSVACAVPTATAAEMRHALSLAQARVVVTEPDCAARVAEAAPGARCLMLFGDPADGADTCKSLLRQGEAAQPDPDTYQAARVGDPAQHVPFILFSSGTTGLPKGVRLRSSALTTTIDNIGCSHDLNSGGPDDQVVLITSPLCWVSGVWQLLMSCVNGYTRVFTRAGDDVTLMATIDKYKVNRWLVASTVLIALVSAYRIKHRSRYDLSSLRVLLTGGSAISSEVQAGLQRDLGCRVIQMYGTTEVGIVFGRVDGELAPDGAIGKLKHWIEMRLVRADTGEDVPAGTPQTVGEVRVRSPYLMEGYVNNPEETTAAYDEAGFFKTGDLVYEDEDGYFYFVDRIKEMIKYRNNQIAPAEVEMVLLQHPGVQEACVLGQPSVADGDVPVAFVVRAACQAGAAVTGDDLKALVAEKLSEYKQLRGGVVFLDHLPRTVSGKVARHELKKNLVPVSV